MKIHIDKQTTKNVFFLRSSDLEMLKSKNIPIKDLANLLYYNISREDLLSWISYQRAMELKLFGRKITRYNLTPPLRFGDQKPKHDMEVINKLLSDVYEEVKYYEDSRFYSSKCGYDTIAILGRNDTLLESGFKVGQASLIKTIYRAALTEVGYYKFYFNEPVPYSDQTGVGVPELIAKVLM